MSVDKFRRYSKKLQKVVSGLAGPVGPVGPVGPKRERGERGLQGERGERGLQSEHGEGINKTWEGDFDIEGKRLINIGTPVHNNATVRFVKECVIKIENLLWSEMKDMRKFLNREFKK